MATPDYDELGMKPLAERSEILPNLFQGRRPVHYDGYDLVVSCEQHLARKPMEGFLGVVVHVALVDDDELPLNNFTLAIQSAAKAAMWCYLSGGKVLVHCTGGLNRSSLVMVETLVFLDVERRDAVNLIRKARDEFCLCNRAFERYALREQLPTAETTIFRST